MGISDDEVFKRLQETIHTAAPEEKLGALRTEMVTPIATIRGYARVLKKEVDPTVIKGLPDEFGEAVDKIIEASDKLYKLLMIYTGRQD